MPMTIADLLVSLIERTGFASDIEKAAHLAAVDAVHALEQRVAALEQRLAGQPSAGGAAVTVPAVPPTPSPASIPGSPDGAPGSPTEA